MDCSLLAAPPCQVSQCNLDSGQCELINQTNGVSCSDDLFCTENDRCSQGECVGGPLKDCSLPLPACQEATCDEDTNSCTTVPNPNGTPCQHANLCLKAASCTAGVCEGTLDDCSSTPVPECHEAVCNPNSGSCEVQPSADGTPCVNTMIACAQSTVCAAGQCVAGAPISQCLNADSCCPSGCLPSNDSDCGATTVRAAVNRGWWSSDGGHDSNNNNTLTGRSNNLDHNAYFSFDLNGLAGTVTSAELHLEVEMYFGSDPSETISLWDVSTPAATLEASGNNPAIYSDLMTGQSYGNAIVLSSEMNTIKVFTLTDAALTDLSTALGGKFSVGLQAATLSSMGPTEEAVRWSVANEPRIHELHLQIQ